MIAVLADLFWLLARPGNLLLLVLLAAVGLAWAGRHRLARALATFAAAPFLLIALLPAHAWIGAPLEERCPRPQNLPDRVDGIVMLGGVISESPARPEEVVINDAAERVAELLRLAHRYPEARLVLTGRGESGPAVQRLLRDLGLDLGRFVFERESRDTYENAAFAKAMAAPASGETWLLVTSARHVPRAIGIFRRLGWEVLPYPVDYRTRSSGPWMTRIDLGGNLKAVNETLYEWVGLFAYRLLGRTSALFPDGP